jgi:hypothetical protein
MRVLRVAQCGFQDDVEDCSRLWLPGDSGARRKRNFSRDNDSDNWRDSGDA